MRLLVYKNEKKKKNSKKLLLSSGIGLLQMLPILSLKFIGDNTFCTVAKNDICNTLVFLKNYFGVQFKVLTMIAGIDYPHQKNRFEVCYELLSIKFNTRLRIKCFVQEVSQLYSVFHIFSSATWWEREIWDLFGIFFINNPDLRRILTDYGFIGHPLRKDFPLTGFVETFFDSSSKTVTYDFLEISQKQRLFISFSPVFEN